MRQRFVRSDNLKLWDSPERENMCFGWSLGAPSVENPMAIEAKGGQVYAPDRPKIEKGNSGQKNHCPSFTGRRTECDMSEKVSSFVPIEIGDFRYLYLLVAWNDFITPIREELAKQVEPFGEALGLKGKIVQAFRSMSYKVFEEVSSKPWDPEIRRRMEIDQDPFLLIIDSDFYTFDPTQQPWAIIWFSEYFKRTDSIYKLFAALVRTTRAGEDVFEYLRSVAHKQAAGKWAKLAKYVEFKPKIFGISIDVGAILEDLGGKAEA